MRRMLLALAGIGLVALATGCCLCASPYDYCGPTFGGDCGDLCLTDARMNSVFAPHPPTTGEGIVVPAGAEGQPYYPEQDAPADGMQPGAETQPPVLGNSEKASTSAANHFRPANFRR